MKLSSNGQCNFKSCLWRRAWTFRCLLIVVVIVFSQICTRTGFDVMLNLEYLLFPDMLRLYLYRLECTKSQRAYGSGLRKVGSRLQSSGDSMPTIYVVTPTYQRYTQKADLTRLSYTLMHVPNILWIVVEDAPTTSALVTNVLLRSGVEHVLLAAQTPKRYKLKNPMAVKNWIHPRGVAQRNAALTWLRSNLSPLTKGVLYFADDDNTYDLRIFEEMRSTKMVSVWPVAFVGEILVERPIVRNGKVEGFVAMYDPSRPFPIDMAAFAVNIRLVLDKPNLLFDYEVKRGYQESHFLQPLVKRSQLEPKAANCTEVLVWHTRTMMPMLHLEKKLRLASGMPIFNFEI
ncbi:galactosylgalactosylxylosylprotein [Trichuris trichiura]|uniref:Galactosylgalactosylxylosylprotein 3-beta-glucuronosyltransferase n=1 Tax=Trichuris trichiura TaxID=36087 RepID=A0A077ZF64_TRITR|nr:galactosylgalactosylxylosylprotein [Trichuris trichiura]